MTTVVVVRKGGQVAIAGDSLVTFGDTRLAHGYEQNEKLFRVGESWVGMSGTCTSIVAMCAQLLIKGRCDGSPPARKQSRR